MIIFYCAAMKVKYIQMYRFKKGNDSFSVFPILSGMDGQLVDGNYYDFSIYSDYGGSGESEDKNVAIAREILLES